MSGRHETDLENARRHVREDLARLERQGVIVSELELAGRARFARWLLKVIWTALQLQRRHLRNIDRD
jgi:hypothetical protein